VTTGWHLGPARLELSKTRMHPRFPDIQPPVRSNSREYTGFYRKAKRHMGSGTWGGGPNDDDSTPFFERVAWSGETHALGPQQAAGRIALAPIQSCGRRIRPGSWQAYPMPVSCSA
jgi:hypothetical protein